MPGFDDLIFPVIAEIRRLDVAATPYDPDFDDPLGPNPADEFSRSGTRGRVEGDPLSIRVQVRDDEYEQLNALANGDSPTSFFDLTAARTDLLAAGLIGADGVGLIRRQDRLVEIRSTAGERLVAFDATPGYYLHEIRPRSFGLSVIHSVSRLYFLHFRRRLAGTAI